MLISDHQRRARLVHRHRLDGTAPDVVTAVHGVVAMHASDPITPYLGVRARVAEPAGAVGALESALYEQRALWRLHAVRRTLFVALLDDAAALAAAARDDIAGRERARLLGWLAPELGGGGAAGAWLDGVSAAVLAALAGTGGLRTTELTTAVPDLATPVTLGAGRFATRSAVASRVLFLLAMDGDVVRGRPAGTWRGSQFAWSPADEWFRARPNRFEDTDRARTHVLRRYLESHGPATRTDLRWWSGWTVRRVDAALVAIGAITVDLDDGQQGWLLADDLDPTTAPEGTVALLPGLDPSPMGWKDRGWFLGRHATRLFDTNGNAGPTVWVDGRVVGGWAVRAGGEVVHELLEDVGGEAAGHVEVACDRLTSWLDGTSVTPRFRTPLERELTA